MNDTRALRFTSATSHGAPHTSCLAAWLGPVIRLIQGLHDADLPASKATLITEITAATDSFRRNALTSGYAADMVDDAVYAVFATIDEVVLTSDVCFRDAWKTRSLQLERFGDQLAGEHFFDRLKSIRERGAYYAEVAQIYHLCLRLGFKGRFALDDSDRLSSLTAALGIDVDHMRGPAGLLAPHAARGDSPTFGIHHVASRWMMAVVLAAGLLGAAHFLRSSAHQRATAITTHAGLVDMPANVARLKINLP